MTLLFLAASAVAIAGAMGVVVAATPVHGVLAMLVNFAGLSALFLSLNAEFLAVAQIIIYAGAVMVLFLFVISLLSARKRPAEDPYDRLRSQLPMAVGAVAVLIAGLLVAVLGPGLAAGPGLPSWQAAPEEFGSVTEFGRVLLEGFPFELEVVGLILLVAMVGVMVIVGQRAERPQVDVVAEEPVPGRETVAAGLEAAAGGTDAGRQAVAGAAGEGRRWR